MTAVVGSLAAALLFAVSAALQQRAAGDALRSAPVEAQRRRRWLPVVAVFGRLVRDRRWLLGWAVNVAGFGLHAVALHFGSITVVQALLLAQLMFAQLLLRRRPGWQDWAGTLTVSGGLGLLLLVRRTVPADPQRVHVPLAVFVVAAGIVGLLGLARVVPRSLGWLRGAVVGGAAGMCFSLTAVFVVLAGADLARGGVAALATDWVLAGLAASTVAGTVLVQDAFAAGPLPIVLTAMSIADPVSSAAIDLLVFDPQTLGVLTLSAYAGVGVVLTIGVVLLVSSPTRKAEARVAAAAAR
ncbi:DMT family transporter [Dactylosporangium siamense]|uniref:DMT family transporter n=1 Tax=Dactylosporangium siamense TaxID=685454 RepID=UPI0019438E59|nr:DMT family transporter [Dactylosporangium siamense]